MTEINQNYDENSIQVLEGLEAVRKRPGMYVGSTGIRGLHHLVYEIVDNGIDEAVNGCCDTLKVTINENNSVTVEDNGRGIPCGIHPKKKISTLEVILSTLHAGGKFDHQGYKTSGGLHGVGSSVVNALSKEFIATINRDGKIYTQSYSKGKKTSEVTIIGETKTTGTIITFMPDDEIFNETIFDYNTLSKRLRELAFLNKKITIIFEDRRIGKEQINSYHYDGGLVEFIKYINQNKTTVQDDIILIEKEGEDFQVDIALQYTDGYNENMFSFVNNINTIEGGYHVNGLYIGITDAVNAYIKKNDLLKGSNEKIQREDVKEGITGVISIKIQDPEFEGQTKTKLGNTNVKGIVSDTIKDFLEVYFYENQDTTNQIIDKIISSQKSRLMAKKAKELSKKKSSLNNLSLPPNKIALCTGKNKEINEFIVVEGDSAGGSAKQGRDRKFQTIMSSKGKIMNVEKQTLEKILDSEELQIFNAAIGTGIGEDFNIKNLKYNYILFLQDADSDGGHIGALWLTYTYRYLRPLIEQGHVYFCVPPLYRNELKKGEFHYTYTEDEQKTYYSANVAKITNIQRYKGLGEMDAHQLWDTTLNPETRELIQVTIEDAIEADQTISLLMSDNVPPRKEFIKNNSDILEHLDI